MGKVKKYLIFVIFVSTFFSIVGQNNLDYVVRQVNSKSHKTIIPTINNLIKIVDASSEEFVSYMKQYNYAPSEVPGTDYTHLVYANDPLILFMNGENGLGVNYIEMSTVRRHASISGAISMLYPNNSLVKLRNELDYYYVDTTSDGVERFVIKDKFRGGYLIQISIQGRTHYFVHIQHFTTL